MNTPRVDTASISAAIQGRRAASGAGRVPALPVVKSIEATDSGRFTNPGLASRLGRAFRDGIDATRTLDALDEVDARLGELSTLVAESAKAETGSLDGIRARIEAVVGSINRAAESVTGTGGRVEQGTIEYARGTRDPSQIPPSPFEVSNVSRGVEQLRAFALLPPGGSLDVNVQVTVSAQQAGFYLSFGRDTLNLSAATARFVIEITGNGGARELSFASGTSINAMRDAINSFTDVTGVVARLSGSAGQPGTGLTLKSVEFGDDQFVSVRVNDSGGINTAYVYAGSYQLQELNNNAANPSESFPNHQLFYALYNPITDSGQDIDGIVNGRNAVGNGRSLYAVTPNLLTQFRLSGAASQSVQPFRAFTISRNAVADAVTSDEPPILDAVRVREGGAPAAAGIDLAKEGIARIRGTLIQRREEQREALMGLLPLRGEGEHYALDAERVRALLTPGLTVR